MKLSKVAKQGLQSGGVLEMMNLTWGNPDVIHLEVGEPGFDTPPHVKRAINQAIDEGYTRYPPTPGLPELRTALVEKVKKKNEINISGSDEIVITSGGANALFTVFGSILDEGDAILLPNPGWDFTKMAGAFGANPIYYSLTHEDNFLPNIEELKDLLSKNSKIKALVINSPSNPLGSVIDSKLAKELYDLCKENDIWLISDEVYDDLDFSGEFVSPGSFEEYPERVISVYSLSKVYAMTGLRVGYCVSSKSLIEIITSQVHASVMTGNASAQYGALAAITGSQEYINEWRDEYRSHRDIVLSKLKDSNFSAFSPDGGFYVWVDINYLGLKSKNFVMALLEEKNVAVTPGSAFGTLGEGFIRISLATKKENLSQGIDRILEFEKSH